MTETDYERLRRELREMEGKNISHYSVLLTAYIRTKMENGRLVAVLSAAGIALMAVVLMTIGEHGAWKLLFMAGAFLGFLAALWISLGALERSAESLLLSLKDGAGRDLKLNGTNGMAKKFFMFGCLCLVVLGLLSVWTPKFKNACCSMKKAAMMKDQPALAAGSAKESAGAKVVDQGNRDSSLFSAGAQDSAKKTITVNISQGAAGSAVSQEAPKKTGNAGLFLRGVSK